MRASDSGHERRVRLQSARLYLVCGAPAGAGQPQQLLAAAVAGGVDVVQLREKGAEASELLATAHSAKRLCERLSVLFIVNDDPELARAVDADGVHLGQDDMSVERARSLLGEDVLIGLSTHTAEQIDAAAATSADYIGVGPVHETPTKPGRPAVGLELVRYAASHCARPFFAIGGLDHGNLGEVLDAGARRIAVVRAIADSPDPRQAACALRQALELHAAQAVAS